MRKIMRRAVTGVLILAIAAAIAWGLRPQPVLVDTAVVTHAPLLVTISDDGQTRIRDRYIVSAPLSGRLLRIELESGDPVKANETLLTTIEPTDPELLDPRAVAQAEARVRAAEIRLKQAAPRSEAVYERMQLAGSELSRVMKLAEENAVTPQEVEARQYEFREVSLEHRAASFEMEIAEYELELARAALTRTGDETSAGDWRFPILSPINGSVLRVFQESSTVINAGDRIIELGDPTDLEVVVDVLSTEAVRIPAGARVLLTQWGGDEVIIGHVRRVEPSAFTKISALGIEEQRVNVVIDFADSQAAPRPLGDGYRVEAAIVEWESDNVLCVPAGALFRDGQEWAVYRVQDGHAVLQHITIGRRNDQSAQVLDGLSDKDEVVLYPGDQVLNGTRIQARPPAQR